MIQANELRIDNYILYDNTICTIEMTNSADIVYVRSLDSEQKDISTETIADRIHPISLTEEILLKCGGNDDCSIDGEYSIIFDIFDVEVSIDPNIAYILFRQGLQPHLWTDNITVEGIRSGFPLNIKYLHQLQNLYFALTGKELEVKL